MYVFSTQVWKILKSLTARGSLLKLGNMVCIVYRRKDYNHMVREQVEISNIFYSDSSSSSSLEKKTLMRANIISGILSILFFQSLICNF